MSAELPGEASVEPGSARRRLNPWLTAAALAILSVLAVLVFWPSQGPDTLDQPERSLERLVGRDMDVRAAAEAAPAWERRLHGLAFSSDAEALASAISWYEELVTVEASPLAELDRIVLLAEDGRTDALQAALRSRPPGDDWTGRVLAWARAAYAHEPPPPEEIRAALAAVRRELSPGWFTDRLAAQLALRLGDTGGAADAERAIQTRGTWLLWRLRGILAAEALLVALGLVALAGWIAGRRPREARVAAAPMPPPWTMAEGVGLFARGAVGVVGMAVVWPFLPDSSWSTLLVGMLQAIPVAGYLLWYCRGSWSTFADLFGLRVPRAALGTLVWTALALVGVSTLADVLTELAGTRLGVSTHWTDGFQERLVWGAPAAVAADILDSCVFAPVVEELLFRGLLYGTLRLRLGPLPATLLSAALFAVAHGYGVIGFASVFGSGVLWALAYERTRSLLPGILAHATGNVQATAIVLATLRF
jgi:hypothetical protein